MRKSMTKLVLLGLCSAGVAMVASAQVGGMMGGDYGMGGSGALVVADDGSLLVTEMGMSSMMGGGVSSERALVDLAPNGTERWRHDFTEGYPMMPVTHGDVVVVALTGDWWMGGSGGDTGWPWGGMNGGTVPDAMQVQLVALSVSSGTQLWSKQLDAGTMSMAEFAPDGSRLYLTTRSFGQGGMMGSVPVQQGAVAGGGSFAGTTVTAIDPTNGNVLWTKSLSGTSTGMMGGR